MRPGRPPASTGRGGAMGDDDGVWTPEIEAAFREALLKWPQCGRRKIVFEGKMYGRNEIIALWIYRKTGQKRTRKQVSSHIQVLGRKRKRETNGEFEGQSSSEIVTRNVVDDAGDDSIDYGADLDDDEEDDFDTPAHAAAPPPPPSRGSRAGGGMVGGAITSTAAVPSKKGRVAQSDPHAVVAVGGPQPLTLTLFSAFTKNVATGHVHHLVHLEDNDDFADPEPLDLTQVQDKFPLLQEFSECTPKSSLFLVKFWADLSFEPPSPDTYFGIDMAFESDESLRIECSTTVILKGKQVVEKIQVEDGRRVRGKTVFDLRDSAMCDVMVKFIDKLRDVETPELANRILENFSVFQVVRDEKTKDVLSCTAFLFEVSQRGLGPRHQVFRMYEPQSK